MNRNRIVNGILGLACLYITITYAISVYHNIATLAHTDFTLRHLHTYIASPLSVLGWAFLTFCFFYVDAFGIFVNVLKAARRAKRINKIRKNKQQI